MRFILGIFAMIGALAFLGCPWRALLRLAGGDLNALVGISGLAMASLSAFTSSATAILLAAAGLTPPSAGLCRS